MKTMLQNCLVIGILVILLSSSCTAAYQVVPTQTVTLAPTPTSTAEPPPYKIVSPEDMRSDLDELFRQIEKIHPDPYMNRPREDVDRERQALYQALNKPMTIVDYYRKVAPLIESLGDPHTSVFPSSDIYQQVASYERFFPLDVKSEAGKAYIVKNYSGNPDIPLGAELLSINGTPLSTLQKNIIVNFSYDFFIDYGF